MDKYDIVAGIFILRRFPVAGGRVQSREEMAYMVVCEMLYGVRNGFVFVPSLWIR